MMRRWVARAVQTYLYHYGNMLRGGPPPVGDLGPRC